MTVALAECALSGGADMRENKGGLCLLCETGEVDTVPGRSGGGEDAGFVRELWGGVVADAETIAVMRASAVEAETGVV